MSTPPGPPRPGSLLTPPPAEVPSPPTASAGPTDGLAASLAGLPVSAHADVLAAEHDRLHRLLATIDQL